MGYVAEYIANNWRHVVSRIEPLIGDWLDFANVDSETQYYNYTIKPETYQSPYYYLRKAIDYEEIKEYGCAKAATPTFIPDTIYYHTYNFMGGLSDKLIKDLDAIITKGDMPDCGRFGVSSWLRKKDDIIPEDRMITFWMSYLKSFIPVVVVDERTMAKHDDDNRDPNEPEENQGKNKILALYLSKSELFAGPCIAICLERIKKNAVNLKISYRNLCIIVLLHELAHAIMDYTNDLGKIESDDGESYIFVKKEEVELDIFKKNINVRRGHFAMEESLANMIMLRYCECYCELHKGSKLLREAKKFVRHQTISYRFGLKQFEAADVPLKIDWNKWRDAKSGKLGLDPNKLANWNSEFVVKGNPYSVSDYNKIFED